jgi:hypothetical protein
MTGDRVGVPVPEGETRFKKKLVNQQRAGCRCFMTEECMPCRKVIQEFRRYWISLIKLSSQ